MGGYEKYQDSITKEVDGNSITELIIKMFMVILIAQRLGPI